MILNHATIPHTTKHDANQAVQKARETSRRTRAISTIFSSLVEIHLKSESQKFAHQYDAGNRTRPLKNHRKNVKKCAETHQ